jgi:hypothetical protein
VTVVAAENVWGSLAAQLGGDRVTVHRIIDSQVAQQLALVQAVGP